MEIIDGLKEAYLNGAKYRYFRIRGLLAYSQYMNSENGDYKTARHEDSSRLDDRAEEIKEKYRNTNIIARLAFELGKRDIRRRPNFQDLEARASRLFHSRFKPFKRDLRLIK